MKAVTRYLNVDLDIYSKSDLEPLVTAFGKKVIVLHIGRERRVYSAHLELARTLKSADSAIRAFCALIQSLPKAERELWNTAKTRCFNIGVQAGTEPFSSEFSISADTTKAASELNAGIIVTVYAPEK